MAEHSVCLPVLSISWENGRDFGGDILVAMGNHYGWGLFVPECPNPQLQNLFTLNNVIKYKASDYPVKEMQDSEVIRAK